MQQNGYLDFEEARSRHEPMLKKRDWLGKHAEASDGRNRSTATKYGGRDLKGVDAPRGVGNANESAWNLNIHFAYGIMM